MRIRITALVSAITAAAVLGGLGACGAIGGENGKGGDSGGGPLSGLRLMVPNTPGGGYDTTARTVAKVMEETEIAEEVQVFNLPGVGGTVGLQRTINERGNGKLAMQMGLGVVGACHSSESKATLAQTTPIARLIEEAGAIVVPRGSPYRSMDDLVTAWKKDPRKVTVGGGSAPGGPDHLLPMQLAKAVGLAPKKVAFVSYDGGGELLPALLGRKIAFGASSYGEFLDQIDAGQVRVLAVTSAKPIDVLKGVPTLKQSGIDLVFTNWRGIVAPPGISEEERQTWVDALTKMRDTELWKRERDKRGWTDAFATGEEFGSYLTQQDKDVAKLLAELGLA